MGNFDLELYPDKAPITVENFLNYVNEGFFDGLIFHRIISSFVIQGGGFDAQMNKKQTKPPIKNEASNGLKNLKYTISMARTNDPNSATSQFFLNVRDNSNLDYRPGNPGYAVFGKIISGFDVIEKIRVVPTTTKGMYQDVPVEPVTMNKVYLKK
ncbi:peptidyl-prolyl cis-trans isomerase [bacterium]|nr:peptidyl-prolyl cis-trans isomerase [bacterium]